MLQDRSRLGVKRTPYVAPDTGVLLAVGFGPGVDFQAPMAIEGMAKARAKSSDCLLLDSVKEEFDGKLAQMENVIEVVRAIQREPAGGGKGEDPMDLLEKIFERVRAERKVPAFFVSAIESTTASIAQANPSISRAELIIELLQGLGRLRTLVSLRVQHLELTATPPPSPRWVHDAPELRDIGRFDFRHVTNLGALGAERRHGGVFFIFDGPLFGRRSQVAAEFPWVRVTNHNYLGKYLEQDSTTWGLPQPAGQTDEPSSEEDTGKA
jgi:hypothetical protein